MAALQLFRVSWLSPKHRHRRTVAVFAAKFVLRRTGCRHGNVQVVSCDGMFVHHFLQHLLIPPAVSLDCPHLPVSLPCGGPKMGAAKLRIAAESGLQARLEVGEDHLWRTKRPPPQVYKATLESFAAMPTDPLNQMKGSRVVNDGQELVPDPFAVKNVDHIQFKLTI